MRKVELTMNEQTKYEIIKNLVDSKGNKQRAAVKIGCTVRNVDRLIKRYKEQGKAGFIHGNHKYKPVSTIPDEVKNQIILLFDKQETLKGYYNVFKQILETYGIPYMFYTDRRTVFEYKKTNSNDLEKNTLTQFGYACQ